MLQQTLVPHPAALLCCSQLGDTGTFTFTCTCTCTYIHLHLHLHLHLRLILHPNLHLHLHHLPKKSLHCPQSSTITVYSSLTFSSQCECPGRS